MLQLGGCDEGFLFFAFALIIISSIYAPYVIYSGVIGKFKILFEIACTNVIIN